MNNMQSRTINDDLFDLMNSLSLATKQIDDIIANDTNNEKVQEEIENIKSNLDLLGEKRYHSKIGGTIKVITLLAQDKLKYYNDMLEIEKRLIEIEFEKQFLYENTSKIRRLEKQNKQTKEIYSKKNNLHYEDQINEKIIDLVLYRLATLVTTTFSKEEMIQNGHFFLNKSEYIYTLALDQKCFSKIAALYQGGESETVIREAKNGEKHVVYSTASYRKLENLSSFEQLDIRSPLPMKALKDPLKLPKLTTRKIRSVLQKIQKAKITTVCKTIERAIILGLLKENKNEYKDFKINFKNKKNLSIPDHKTDDLFMLIQIRLLMTDPEKNIKEKKKILDHCIKNEYTFLDHHTNTTLLRHLNPFLYYGTNIKEDNFPRLKDLIYLLYCLNPVGGHRQSGIKMMRLFSELAQKNVNCTEMINKSIMLAEEEMKNSTEKANQLSPYLPSDSFCFRPLEELYSKIASL